MGELVAVSSTEAGKRRLSWAPSHNDLCAFRVYRGERGCDCGLAADIAAIEAEAIVIYREKVEKAIDVGMYPKSSPNGDRTPWQDGWNAACIAIGDAVDTIFKTND